MPVHARQGVEIALKRAIERGLTPARANPGRISAAAQKIVEVHPAVPGDPLKDITELERVRFVMKGGVVYGR